MATKGKAVIIDGKQVGSLVTSKKTGKRFLWLNPAGMVEKCRRELQSGCRFSSDLRKKLDEKGKVIPLTEKERQWRVGYLAHARDSAAIYNLKKGGKR